MIYAQKLACLRMEIGRVFADFPEYHCPKIPIVFRALSAAAAGVDLARTTKRTPSHSPASTLTSVTGKHGGESIITQSKRGARRPSNFSKLPLESNSLGFLSPFPAAMKHSFPSWPC